MADEPIKDVKDIEAPATEPEQTTETSAVAETTEQPAQSDSQVTGTSETAAETKPEAQPADTKADSLPPQKHGLRATATIKGLKRESKELRDENLRLQRQLEQAMGNPVSQLTRDERKPEDTAAYWKQKAEQAATDQERQDASLRYWSLLPADIERQAVSKVMNAVGQFQRNQVLARKLQEIHERTPIFDANGRPDPQSAVVQRACELADTQNVAMFTDKGAVNHAAMEYFCREAAWEMEGRTQSNNAAALEQQRVQTLKATARVGLETTSPAAPSKASGPTVDLEKEIADLEKRKSSMGMKIDVDLNTRLSKLRSDLRDARLRTSARK